MSDTRTPHRRQPPTRVARLEEDLRRGANRVASRGRGTAGTGATGEGRVVSQSFDGGHAIQLDYDERVHGDRSRLAPRPGRARATSLGTLSAWEALAAQDDATPATGCPPAPTPVAPVAPPATAVPVTPVPPSPAEHTTEAPSRAQVPPVPRGDPARDDDAVFAQDLQAILGAAPQSLSGHTGAQDPAAFPPQPGAAAPTTPPETPGDRVDTAPPAGTGAAQRHDIFDRMGEQLAFANRFELGPIALSATFDAFDRAIEYDDRVQATTPARGAIPPARATALEVLDDHLRARGQETAQDGSAQPQPEPTPAPPVWRVTHQVDLVPQLPGLSCWAAAAASLVAWRDNVRATAQDIVDARGYWEQFSDGRTAEGVARMERWPLTFLAPAAIELPRVRELLERHGPLLVGPSESATHVVVLAGLTGDGTAAGTVADVVDPWAQGMTTFAVPNPGSRYSEPWSAFVDRIQRMGSDAAQPGSLTLAHLRPRHDERSS